MKKKLFCLLTIAATGLATFTFAQDTAPAPAAPAPVQTPTPGVRPLLPPGMRRNVPAVVFTQTVYVLQRAKTQLEHSTNDYNGHRQSALDACDKAIKELEAVQAAMKTSPPPQPTAPTAPAAPPTQ